MLGKFKIIPRGINLVLSAIATTLLIVYQGVAMDHTGYEVWGSDQSNSVVGIETIGTDGGVIWIWDSKDIEQQIESGIEAQPLGCDGNNRAGDGPCDVNAVFPPTLTEYNENGATGQTIADLPGFGRLHGMITDPQNKYLNLNLFAPTGGYVGIMDGETKEAIALFRVTGTNGSPAGRSVHMSFWNDTAALF